MTNALTTQTGWFMNNKEIKVMGMRELKALLKQFRSGIVGMGMRDIYLMHLIEDEIDRRTNR